MSESSQTSLTSESGAPGRDRKRASSIDVESAGPEAAAQQIAPPAALLNLLVSVDGAHRTKIVTGLQRTRGNDYVQRMLARSTANSPFAEAGRVLHRHALEGDDRDNLKAELAPMNGLSIEDLLSAMAGKDAHTRGHYIELAAELGDVAHEERLRICAKAVDAKGTSAAAFALANEADLTAVVGGMGGGHVGQMDSILKFVDGSFDAKRSKLVAGDKLATNLGGDGAIVRPDGIRIRTSGALTWMAANPGAIGAAPAFKPVGAYAGKTLGSAGLSIFPDDDTGFAGLLQWIQLKADGGSTCGSFFHAHAPTAEDLAGRLRKREGRDPTQEEMTTFEAATKGNDPEGYLADVAKALGSNADALRGKPLKSVDPAAFGAAIRTKEGWVVGKSLGLDDAVKDSTLPAPTRFRLLYTKLAGGVS